MKRTALGFSLRVDAKIPLSEMRNLVAKALGCQLVEADYHGTPVLMSELLGMRILLLQWFGLNRELTFQLHGLIDDPKYLEGNEDEIIEVVEIDISQAVIDLLLLKGAGEWRIPSCEEIEAEIDYEKQVQCDFLTPEEGPRFEPEEDS